MIAATALSLSDVILFESVLSFLGLGVQPPLSSWDSMLSNAQELITAASLLEFYLRLMILTVVVCNPLGDALQRRWTPLLQEPAEAWCKEKTAARGAAG